MDDATDNLVLDYLKQIQAELEARRDRFGEIITRLGRLEQGQAVLTGTVAELSVRMDRLAARLDRIDQRLDLM